MNLDVVDVQSVRTKGIQNKIIFRKLTVIHDPVYVIGKKSSESFFLMPGLRACANGDFRRAQ
jgi:hypothetical protein